MIGYLAKRNEKQILRFARTTIVKNVLYLYKITLCNNTFKEDAVNFPLAYAYIDKHTVALLNIETLTMTLFDIHWTCTT